MSKVRRIHKGLGQWDELGETNSKGNKDGIVSANIEGRKGGERDGLNLECNNVQEGYQDYDDEYERMNELEKFKERAELAKKLGGISVDAGHGKNKSS
jgi:hypothetical protein